jgi:hypothetical protein
MFIFPTFPGRSVGSQSLDRVEQRSDGIATLHFDEQYLPAVPARTSSAEAQWSSEVELTIGDELKYVSVSGSALARSVADQVLALIPKEYHSLLSQNGPQSISLTINVSRPVPI